MDSKRRERIEHQKTAHVMTGVVCWVIAIVSAILSQTVWAAAFLVLTGVWISTASLLWSMLDVD